MAEQEWECASCKISGSVQYDDTKEITFLDVLTMAKEDHNARSPGCECINNVIRQHEFLNSKKMRQIRGALMMFQGAMELMGHDFLDKLIKEKCLSTKEDLEKSIQEEIAKAEDGDAGCDNGGFR